MLFDGAAFAAVFGIGDLKAQKPCLFSRKHRCARRYGEGFRTDKGRRKQEGKKLAYERTVSARERLAEGGEDGECHVRDVAVTVDERRGVSRLVAGWRIEIPVRPVVFAVKIGGDVIGIYRVALGCPKKKGGRV